VYNHTFFPIRFDDLEKEYSALINDVTLWDVCVERQVEITGPDAAAFTNLLTPRDLEKCKVGQAKYVIITTDTGGIINDPVLLRLGQNHFWLALADSDVLLWARGVAARAGMRVEITEPDVSPLQLQGPKSKDVAKTLFGDRVLDLGYYYFFETSLDGIPVVVTRTGWSAEVGYEIYLRDGSKGDALWERIMEAGKPHGIRPTGPSDIRRVEGGILNWGADILLEDTPLPRGARAAGGPQEDERLHGQGGPAPASARRAWIASSRGVEIAGPPIAFNATKWPVSAGGKRVGRITSAIYSPRLKKNIGYAMVPVQHAELGSKLVVAIPRGRRP
jgi:aminomethyltransferase